MFFSRFATNPGSHGGGIKVYQATTCAIPCGTLPTTPCRGTGEFFPIPIQFIFTCTSVVYKITGFFPITDYKQRRAEIGYTFFPRNSTQRHGGTSNRRFAAQREEKEEGLERANPTLSQLSSAGNRATECGALKIRPAHPPLPLCLCAFVPLCEIQPEPEAERAKSGSGRPPLPACLLHGGFAR